MEVNNCNGIWDIQKCHSNTNNDLMTLREDYVDFLYLLIKFEN